jgi:hypothetical protein
MLGQRLPQRPSQRASACQSRGAWLKHELDPFPDLLHAAARQRPDAVLQLALVHGKDLVGESAQAFEVSPTSKACPWPST